MQDVKRLHPAFRDSQTTAQKRKWLTADATAPWCGLDSQEVPEGTLEFPEALPSQGPPIPGKCTTAESPPPRPREAHPSDCGEPVRQTSPSDSLRLSSGEMRTPPQYDTTICKQRIFTGWKCKSLRIFPFPACKRSGKHSTFPALLCLSSYGIVTLTTGKPGTGQRRRQHNAHFRPTCP